MCRTRQILAARVQARVRLQEPEQVSEPAAGPEQASEQAAEPERASEPAAEPEQVSEQAAEPERAARSGHTAGAGSAAAADTG